MFLKRYTGANALQYCQPGNAVSHPEKQIGISIIFWYLQHIYPWTMLLLNLIKSRFYQFYHILNRNQCKIFAINIIQRVFWIIHRMTDTLNFFVTNFACLPGRGSSILVYRINYYEILRQICSRVCLCSSWVVLY